jgi:holo-[acyl-carrier protein] synthase|tara:strand:+ start:235 stop:627 length:393 start_codon:yes stop_codon:yes gene_type:complete
MKIFGIGTDIVSIKRIKKSLKLHGSKFKKRVFTNKEIKYCEKKSNPSAFFAKRFAAKEALSKAIGIGISKGLNLKDIEVLNDFKGKPSIQLNGKAKIIVKKKINNKKYNVHLSLSDDEPWAIATVIVSYR